MSRWLRYWFCLFVCPQLNKIGFLSTHIIAHILAILISFVKLMSMNVDAVNSWLIPDFLWLRICGEANLYILFYLGTFIAIIISHDPELWHIWSAIHPMNQLLDSQCLIHVKWGRGSVLGNNCCDNYAEILNWWHVQREKKRCRGGMLGYNPDYVRGENATEMVTIPTMSPGRLFFSSKMEFIIWGHVCRGSTYNCI